MGVSLPLGQGPMDQEILGRERGHATMWRSVIPLSEVLRMVDLIKEISIDKYSQEEYRQVLNEIMYISITDYDSEEVQNEHLFSPS